LWNNSSIERGISLKGLWKHFKGSIYEVLDVVTEDGVDYVLYRKADEEGVRVNPPISFVALDVLTNEEVLVNKYRNAYDILHTGVKADNMVYRYFIREKGNFLEKVGEVSRFEKIN